MYRDPSWYELEYNPRLTVQGYEAYFRRWAEDSKRARESVPYVEDVGYGHGPKETLDLFVGSKNRALLVFFHGGYWRSFDKRDFSWLAPPLLEQGIGVAVVNYGLCPDTCLEEIVDQCRRAIAWLYFHRHAYGLSEAPLIISGHSAGGHLTAEMFATRWPEYGVDPGFIRGGISISGLFDLEPLLLVSVNRDIGLDSERARSLSPVYKRPFVDAPLVLAVGALESTEFHRQSHLLKAAWPDICTEVVEVPDAHHFNVLDSLTDIRSPLWAPLHMVLQ